ncbi:MAG: endopeptidase La, partial [Gammaproteobacteria bacterium]|nr:endopeptidase La [Gammaproteobacteria bacterium]
MVIPLFVGREKSVEALDAAMSTSKQIILVAQKDADIEDPGSDDVHDVGTVSTVLQLLKLPDGTIKVLVEGENRVRISQIEDTGAFFCADAEVLENSSESDQDDEREALTRSLSNLFGQYIKVNKKIPKEVMASLSGINDASRLADTIAAHIPLKLDEKQKMLELVDVKARLTYLFQSIESELDILQVEKRIRQQVKQQMEKSQREYYLNEKMKAIQKELGDLGEDGSEIEQLEKKISSAGMSKEAFDKAKAELAKLKIMSPMSAESGVIRNYLDTLISVPWKQRSKVKSDLAAAEKTLNDDHSGLEKVKERILEYLAVQKRARKLKGPILCLVGPPGVGKTSLGRSIARATGRSFSRISLGGIRDEAEIRGHRRTYVGSMPGKIAQKLIKVGKKNPLILLDEIDKMSMDFRGDPSSALLEVLDPEQNNAFGDHFLEVDIDLSDVMFIATANSLNIPAPLLDRMEVIRIPGYTEQEKQEICTRYLVPKNLKNSGLKSQEIKIQPEAVTQIIREYTREAGVRGLDRAISKICRKVVREILTEKPEGSVIVTSETLDNHLGIPQYRYGVAEHESFVGQVTGLAWTEVGGELLSIEAVVVPGSGKLSYTGKLGDVMQESIQAAMMVIRSRADALRLHSDFYKKYDLHIHVPEGAIPKDGPSAGVAMCTALVSALTRVPVDASVAMTGEITLRGKVLPIGGVKEKLLAAIRGRIKTAIIPEDNEKDLADISSEVLGQIKVIPVSSIDEVLEVALIRPEAEITS